MALEDPDATSTQLAIVGVEIAGMYGFAAFLLWIPFSKSNF
jgi:hypothetical protein